MVIFPEVHFHRSCVQMYPSLAINNISSDLGTIVVARTCWYKGRLLAWMIPLLVLSCNIN
jgi:hypothetical protein